MTDIDSAIEKLKEEFEGHYYPAVSVHEAIDRAVAICRTHQAAAQPTEADIERVARAICYSQTAGASLAPFRSFHDAMKMPLERMFVDANWISHARTARVAIDAMPAAAKQDEADCERAEVRYFLTYGGYDMGSNGSLVDKSRLSDVLAYLDRVEIERDAALTAMLSVVKRDEPAAAPPSSVITVTKQECGALLRMISGRSATIDTVALALQKVLPGRVRIAS